MWGPEPCDRAPLRSVEWQEQPAHWLEAPLAPHHRLVLTGEVKGSATPGLEGCFLMLSTVLCPS